MEEFAARMLGMMNEASLALMVSVGHRTGLFDAMAQLPAATSASTSRRRRAWTSGTSGSGWRR